MSCENELEINGVKYAKVVPSDSPIQIVVLQRGNVVVGRFSIDGEMCRLENASVIRVWGTTKGLGQIALNGPTSKTVLDAAGTIKFHIMTTVMMLDCDESQWA